MLKKKFINRDQFSYFVVAYIAIVFCVMIAYFHIIQSRNLTDNFIAQSQKVEKELTSSIDYVKSKLFYIANDLSLYRHYSHDKIGNIIKAISRDTQLQELLSSKKVRWIENDGREKINAEGEKTNNTLSAAHAELLSQTKQVRNILYFGVRTHKKRPEGKSYIPAALGVQNHKGEYIGTLIVEISVSKLQKLINNYISPKNQKLYMLHQDLIPLLVVPASSYIEMISNKEQDWLAKSKKSSNQKNHHISSSFLRLGKSTFLIRLTKLPFMIYITDNNRITLSEAALVIFSHISDFLLIILCATVILQTIRRVIIRTSLSNDYIIFATIATISATFVCIWLVWSIYQNEESDRNFEYRLEADKIASTMEGQFDYAANIGRYVGGKISKMPEKRNLKEVAALLGVRPVKEQSPYDIFSATMLDFLNEKNYMVANGDFGVLENPFEVTGREYLAKTRITPWKLHVEAPLIGNTSGEYVIPAAIGLTDHKTRKHIGLITLGFNVSKLKTLLESSLPSSNTVSFMVLTKRLQPVLISSDNKESGDIEQLANKLQYVYTLGGDAGFLEEPIHFGDVEYGYYRETFKYPYIILVGRHKNIKDAVFRSEILPRLIQVAGTWLFILILLFFFQMKIVSPMVRLSQAASRLSKNQLDTQIPRGGSVEAYNLARSLIKVKYAIRKEQRLKKAIEKANQGKTDFLLATAHELRSPLNAIIGLADLIRNDKKTDKTKEYAQDIQEAGKELLEFISDLLDLNQAESGNFMIYRLEYIKIAELIKRSIKLNISRAQYAGINIQSDIPEGLPRIKGSERRLKQVLVNLLTNSIKYSPEKTVIRVEACKETREHQEGVRMSIIDQGQGMTETELQVALVKWGKGDGGNSTVDSFGLGLPLVRHLVKLHNGEMDIQSKKGEGTQVNLWFPAAKERRKKG